MYQQDKIDVFLQNPTQSSVNHPKVGHSSASTQKNTDWYHSMAQAWGSALDKQAQKLLDFSQNIDNDATVGQAIMVSAHAHQLSFMSNAASTTSNSVGQALETLAKKQ
ncbi:MAG: hypothetical protein ACRBHB_26280 [Arenicella sp.]